VISDAETKILIRVGAIYARYSERISKLPKNSQDIFIADLETAIVNRLKVLESTK
jgi:hypothetical protein